MYCFPLIKLVLDDLYQQIPFAYDVQKIAAVRCELEVLNNDYKKLCMGGTINYNNPATRFAYTYCYAGSHADVMYQIINNNHAVKRILSNNALNIACLGGGPGSDLLGTLKFMRLQEISAKLICNIYDREDSWKPCIESITNQLKVFMRRAGRQPTILGNVLFHEVDIVKDIEKIIQQGIADLNLLTVSFLVSELKQDEAQKVFLKIFDKIPPGCTLILVDNCSGDAHERFDTIVNEYNYSDFIHPLECVDGKQKTFSVDTREEKTDLEPYLTMLNWSPRLTLPVHYRIYLKI